MALPRMFAAAQGPPGRCKHRPLQCTPSGFAPGIKYAPIRPPCQRGLAAGKARRLGDCPPRKNAAHGGAHSRGLPSARQPPPGSPALTRAPFHQRHFKAKQSLRPRFARPPPFDKGGQTPPKARRFPEPCGPQKNAPTRPGGRAGAGDSGLAQNHSALELFFKITSWLPPSTMEVEDTTVSRAFSCSSGMVSAPQLHMVDFTLYSVVCTPSASGPA